ncbi:hypothetical protein TIFTF001_027301 [Ficus carica]|uniref:Uncharacterized protein n=1 Tax=Ficus carica TaxID=3494 RepID=A0AA88DMW0_FICCA|nr:hypothetical protein TIFTF001_027301 [Ficus carica]
MTGTACSRSTPAATTRSSSSASTVASPSSSTLTRTSSPSPIRPSSSWPRPGPSSPIRSRSLSTTTSSISSPGERFGHRARHERDRRAGEIR